VTRLPPNRVPTYDQLNYPSLEALRALGGSATIAEHLDKLIQLQGFDEDVINRPHGNTSRSELEYRLAWSRTALRRAGLIENSSRGVWSITPAGEMIGEPGVSRLIGELREQDRAAHRARGLDAPVETEQPDSESLDWTDHLLAKLRSMHPTAFEKLSQRLLRESGFSKVEVTGRTGDGGIDGTGILQLNLISFPVLFQCKRYERAVTPSEIRDFRGAMMGRTDKGLFITTGSFSSAARAEATRDGAPSIELIDGQHLTEHLKRLSLGVRTELVEQVQVLDEWFENFE
jgi:restriction system protein